VNNDESEVGIAKHLSYDEVLYYKYVIQFAGERIFKIGEHLAKLQSEWLIVSYTPFALDVADATRLQYCHTAQDHSMQTRRWPI